MSESAKPETVNGNGVSGEEKVAILDAGAQYGKVSDHINYYNQD